jgi:hypothetical protein
MLFEALAGVATAFEHSGLGQAARSAGWLYPLANVVHVLGAALLVGSIATFDIQVLRHVRDPHAVYQAGFSVAVFGFFLQVVSGIVLLSADASTLVRNPAFLFKMVMLVVGVANAAVFHWCYGRAFKGPTPLRVRARVLAAVSLTSWVLVLLAGRAIAYL